MARLIDADDAKVIIEERYDTAFMQSRTRPNIAWWEGYSAGVNWARNTINDAPTVDAVPVVHFNALKSLINGEWVDCELVEEALDIDFATGLKMFNFSRTAEWNPAPLNGQKITTKFRMKNAVDLEVDNA